VGSIVGGVIAGVFGIVIGWCHKSIETSAADADGSYSGKKGFGHAKDRN
jgi:hypothetical protein